MNPFLFEDIGSAVPDIYNDFCKMLGNRSITIENSFAIAKEYISSFGADYISEAFGWRYSLTRVTRLTHCKTGASVE